MKKRCAHILRGLQYVCVCARKFFWHFSSLLLLHIFSFFLEIFFFPIFFFFFLLRKGRTPQDTLAHSVPPYYFAFKNRFAYFVVATAVVAVSNWFMTFLNNTISQANNVVFTRCKKRNFFVLRYKCKMCFFFVVSTYVEFLFYSFGVNIFSAS